MIERVLVHAPRDMADDELKTRDRLDMLEFIRRRVGVDKLKPGQGTGPPISVVPATEADMLEGVEAAPRPVPDSESGMGHH